MTRVAAGRQALAAAAIVLVVFATPLGWRAALHAWGPRASDAQPSYLPALESARPREAFVADPIDDLRRLAPGYVLIGDSMAGRIDFDRLAALSSEAVGPLLQNASGSAYWYLVLKNYVIPSGVRPRQVVVFFRDTQLTDVLFRIDGPYRPALDQVARPLEPELNDVVAARTRGPWHAVHRLMDQAYAISRAREWIGPALTAWPARMAVGARRAPALLARVNNAFTLDALRPMAQADLAETEVREADFAAHVNISTLPLMLAAARDHGLHLCFVRVLRRPVNGAPPPESPELQRYAVDLRAYVTAHGGSFIDDRDDPALALLPYADGDHVAREARIPYTDRFWDKVRRLPR